jgi:DNA-binding PadR family transcriptional regulator
MADRVRQRSPLGVVVLALLREGPMHAYRVHELIKAWGKDKVVNVAQRNSVYQTLERLHRAGFVEVHTTARDAGRPERVVYALTEEGARTLQEWLEEMVAVPTREFPEAPVAMAFLMLLDPEVARTLVERRVLALRSTLEASAAAARGAREQGLPRLFLLEEELQQAVLGAELTWFEALADDLRSGALTWSEAWLKQVRAGFGPG